MGQTGGQEVSGGVDSPVLRGTAAAAESPALSDVCWSLLLTGLCSAAFADCVQHTEVKPPINVTIYNTLFISDQNELKYCGWECLYSKLVYTGF